MTIKIKVLEGDEVIAKSEAKDFESAEEELGKLERHIKGRKLKGEKND